MFCLATFATVRLDGAAGAWPGWIIFVFGTGSEITAFYVLASFSYGAATPSII